MLEHTESNFELSSNKATHRNLKIAKSQRQKFDCWLINRSSIMTTAVKVAFERQTFAHQPKALIMAIKIK